MEATVSTLGGTYWRSWAGIKLTIYRDNYNQRSCVLKKNRSPRKLGFGSCSNTPGQVIPFCPLQKNVNIIIPCTVWHTGETNIYLEY